MSAAARNLLLRDFLRARRGEIDPARAGLPDDGRRRVPGLRREEAAMLAGVSVDYYTRLEQGRDITPSDSVLDAVARVLCLTAAQRAQLDRLVRPAARRSADPADSAGSADSADSAGEEVRPTVLKLVAALDLPAIVVGRGTAVVASNPLHQALTTDFSAQPRERRFYAYWLFADPAARDILLDWARSARETVGILRASTTRFPDDRRLAAVVDDLSATSPEFASLWHEHDVEEPTSGQKRYRHPVAGEITVLHEVAQLSDEHWLHVYWAEPGSSSEAALNVLRAAASR